MDNQGCTTKEPTIRGLIKECRGLQGEIRSHLEKDFNRNPKDNNVKIEGKPPLVNVLDEIMDELKGLSNSQKETIDFIIHCISPKL